MSEKLSVLVEATGAEGGMKEDIWTCSVISSGKRSEAAGRGGNRTQLVTARSHVPFYFCAAKRSRGRGNETKSRKRERVCSAAVGPLWVA